MTNRINDALIMKHVCLVLVTYNRLNVLLETIQFVLRQTTLPKHFIIIDNKSQDGTYEHLVKLQSSSFEILQSQANDGYGAAASFGIKYALSRYNEIAYFWVMDDDSRPSATTLEAMVNSYENLRGQFRMGMLGLTGFKLKFGGYSPVTSDRPMGCQYLQRRPVVLAVDFVLMDGCLIATETINSCGVYKEDYFMIGEDYEYCKRVLKGGYINGLLLDEPAKIERLVLGAGGRFSRSSIWRGYYQARNHVHILRDYFSFRSLFSYILRQIKFLFYSLLAPDRFTRIYFRFLGILHGLLGVKGRSIEPFN
jgi:rhamnopyranosyl-N-acetylglucosaminyl-diphospho-decaprenol beta-1,3/1,4-galactofuranosyltransferase